MAENFAGLRALITGGSKGMGFEWARLLVNDGAHVTLWGRSLADLKEAKKKLETEFVDSSVDVASVDMTKIGALNKALDHLLESHHVDLLINNAGTVVRGAYTSGALESHLDLVSLNLKAPMVTVYRVLEGMKQRNFGYIVNVSSLAGFIGVPMMASYSASKWGLLGFSEALRLELKDQGLSGIKVMSFCPSYVKTGLFAGAKPPLFTKWLLPEATVKRAYKGLKDGKQIVIDPDIGRIIPSIKGILPDRLSEPLWRIMGVHRSAGGTL